MSPDQIKSYLKKAFWDVNSNPDDLYKLLAGEIEASGNITRERLFQRLIETYSWYKILEIVPDEQLPELFSENVRKRLRSKSLQQRYEALASILQENTVSTAGQSAQGS